MKIKKTRYFSLLCLSLRSFFQDAVRQALIDTLKNDNSHNWDDTYPGRNIGTGSYSWSVIIEYKGGVIEKHIGYGNDCKLPRGFIELKNKLYGYKYE